MRPRSALVLVALLLSAWGALLAQKPWRQYQGERYSPVPPDFEVPHEWVTARLMYHAGFGGRGFFGGNSWATDYPEGDRHLIEGVRRLSRIDVRSVEQPVELDGSDETSTIGRSSMPSRLAVGGSLREEAAQLRGFLDRGGFLMVDDFHGTYQWEDFMSGPRDGVSARDKDRRGHSPPTIPIMHMLSDVDQSVAGGGHRRRSTKERTYEQDGITPSWRAVRDDRGPVVVAICHNMDLGDAWEHSDNPAYPADMAGDGAPDSGELRGVQPHALRASGSFGQLTCIGA